MATNVEERIVQMKFDNAQFEQGIKTSMSSLESFDKSLRSKEGTQGLASIAENVEKVSSKFSAMGVVATTTLVNITNSAVNAGKRIASALTIEPIKSGFDEYQQQIDSTMVIMSNTGDNLKTVTAALDELNVYADKTVYSFGDMTNAIGKFAAAGVKLKPSVAAIKGLSNAAALVGAQGHQLQSAYYNLSQSLQAGYLTTIDYNSLANSTIMNDRMRKLLVDTAIEMGKFSKDSKLATEAYTNFKETLQKKWLTNDIILKTLEKYSDDTTEIGKLATEAATEVRSLGQLWETMTESVQTSWADSWKVIIGDLEESKKLFTSLSSIFEMIVSGASKTRLSILNVWRDNGGRDAAIKSLFNIINAVLKVTSSIKKGFQEIFPPKTGKDIANITKKIQLFTEKLYLSKDAATGLKNIIKMLLIPIKGLSDIAKSGVIAIGKILVKLANFTNQIFEIIGNSEKLDNTLRKVFGNERYTRILVALIKICENFLRVNENIRNEFQKIKDEIINSDIFKSFFGDLNNLENIMKNGILDAFVLFLETLAEINIEIPKISEVFSKTFNALEIVIGGFSKLGNAIMSAITSGRLLTYVFGVGLIGIILLIVKLISNFAASFTNLVNIGRKIVDVFDGIGDLIDSIRYERLSNSALKLGIAIGILAASLVSLASIEPNNLWKAFGAISLLAAELVGMVIILDKFGNSGKKVSKFGTMMLSLSSSVWILASAIKKIGEMDSQSLSYATEAIIIMTAALAGIGIAMSKLAPRMSKGTSSILMMAIAVRILIPAIEQLGSMDLTDLVNGLIATVGILTTLGLVIGTLSKVVPELSKGGITILALAVSARILVNVIQELSTIEINELGKGLISLIGVLGTIAIGAGLLAKLAPKLSLGSVGVLFLAAAVRVLVPALEQLSQFDGVQIATSLGMLAGSMTILGLTSGLLGKFAPLAILGGTAILVLAAAVRVLVPALEQLSKFDITQITTSLGMLAGSMTILGLTVGLLGTFAPMAILGSAAILALSLAVRVLVPALEQLSQFDGAQIATSLGMLAGSMLILGGVSGLLGVFAPMAILGSAAILAMAIAIRILTPALKSLGDMKPEEIGNSLLALIATAGGLAILSAAMGLLAIPALAASIAMGALAISVALLSPALLAISNIPLMEIAQGLVEFGGGAVVAGTGGILLIAGSAGVLLFAGSLVILAGAIALLGTIIKANETVNQLFMTGADLMNEFISGIKSTFGDLEIAASDAVNGFVNGIAGFISNLWETGVNAGKAFIEGFRSKDGIDSHSDSKQTIAIANDGINGFVNGVKNRLTDLLNSGEDSGQTYLKGLSDELNHGTKDIQNAMVDIFDGDQGYKSEIETNGKDTGKLAVDSILVEIDSHAKEIIDNGGTTGDIWIEALKATLLDRGYEISNTATAIMENANSAARKDMLEAHLNDIDWFFKPEETEEAADTANDYSEAISGAGISSGKASKDIDKATDSILELKKGIESGIDIFSKFDDTVDITMEDMIVNLQSQLDGVSKWSQDLGNLAAKGFDEGFVQVLAEKGLSGYKYVEAMQTATEMQVFAYNYMFKESTKSADAAIEFVKQALPTLTAKIAKETGKSVELVGHAVEEGEEVVDVTKEISDVIEDTTEPVEDLNDSVETEAELMKQLTQQMNYAQYGILGVAETTDTTVKSVEDLNEVVLTEEELISKLTEEMNNAQYGIDGVSESTEEFGNSIEFTTEQAIEFVKGMAKIDSELNVIRQSLKETIESQIDIFEKFDTESKISKDELLANMQSQIDGVTSWASKMNQLFDRGINEGLLAHLRELGPEGTKYVDALLDMSGEELVKVGELYEQSLVLPDTVSQQMIDKMRESGTYSVQGLIDGITEMQEAVYNAGMETAFMYNAGYTEAEEIHSPSVVQFNNGVNDAQGLIDGINSMIIAVQNTGRALGYALTNNVKAIANYNVFYHLGLQIDKGLADGIRAMTANVAQAAAEMARAAYEAACAELGIASPSKMFREIGMYSDIGFANGLRDYAGAVEESSKTVGETALESMRDSINKLNAYAMSDIDEVVIRPILDLSEIQNGAKDVNSIFSKGINTTASIAADSYKTLNASREAQVNGTTQTEQVGAPTYNFTQNNYSPKALSRIDIYRQTKNQLSAAKGLVNGI